MKCRNFYIEVAMTIKYANKFFSRKGCLNQISLYSPTLSITISIGYWGTPAIFFDNAIMRKYIIVCLQKKYFFKMFQQQQKQMMQNFMVLNPASDVTKNLTNNVQIGQLHLTQKTNKREDEN